MTETTTRDNPGPRLETAFRHIAATSMATVPILNPALAVEALGFRVHEGRWLGVLITPWFMNLVAMPGPADDWAGMSSGSARGLALPAGEVKFLHAHEDTMGPYLSYSLFSPMRDFPDQAYARSVAEEVLRQLFTSPAEAEAAGAKPGPGSGLERTLSRRGFLSALLPSDKRA